MAKTPAMAPPWIRIKIIPQINIGTVRIIVMTVAPMSDFFSPTTFLLERKANGMEIMAPKKVPKNAIMTVSNIR